MTRFAERVERARARIRPDIVRTPLEYSPVFSLALGAHVYFKWECDQTTGSFKFRGALNRIRTLSGPQKRRGIISASTGNHGLAVALAAQIESVNLTLYLPENASPVKIAKIRKAGATLRFFGTDCQKTEIHARGQAEASDRVYISPYNDADIVCGQGTIGIEILEDLPHVEDILVPVGGGGLMAGIAGYVKSRNPAVRIFGVEPAVSAFMAASLEAGRLVGFPETPTLADAVAGGIEPGSITFPLCRAHAAEILTVTEDDLSRAMRAISRVHGRIVEGAGALALAGLFAHPDRFGERRVVAVASGKNISPRHFKTICASAAFRI